MQHLYFMGIGGQTMSGLAIASKQAGFKVSGVDSSAYPPTTEALAEAGIHYHTSYDPEHLEDEMVVILANAITEDNIELQAAMKRKLPILSFPQLIEQLTAKQHRIVVTGTHGKTTTSTLIGWMLETAKQKPDVITGMSSRYFGGSVRLRGSKKVVIEGDEYSSSSLDHASKFLYYHPDVLVITSLEYDHPDLFENLEAIKSVFAHLIEDMDENGVIVACGDDQEVLDLLQGVKQKVILYGMSNGNDWQVKNIEYGPNETIFTVYRGGQESETWTTPLAGEHNIKNAMAALVVADLEGVTTHEAAAAIHSFTGPSRRFEVVASINDVNLIDDYGHHPTAVAATLQAARNRYPDRKIWAMFKPHTYSRTAALLRSFAAALQLADVVLLSEVDASRESGNEAVVNSVDLAAEIQDLSQTPHYLVDNSDAQRLLTENLQPGDVVVFMHVHGLQEVIQGVARELSEKWPI